MCSYNINPDKRYQIAKDISIVNYKNKILVIAPSTANWIILESSSQLSVFEFLKDGHSINETLTTGKFNQQDVIYVVTQIEARKLCSKKAYRVTDEAKGLHIYLTNRCNLSCPHCYMFSGKANDNELTTDEIINLIRDYKQIANGHRVILSGGEPTIRPDFEQIVKSAYEFGMEIKILTNGTLIEPEKIKYLSKYIASVQISIDGFSEKSNSIIRGTGHFQKALAAIDAFVNNEIETSVAITPTFELLQNDKDEYVSFAKRLSMRYMNKSFQVKFAEGLSRGRNINPSKIQNNEYANLIKEIQKHIYGEDYDLISFVDTMRNNVIMDNCMFGVFAVASDGDVYFCPEIGELSPIANIRTSPFSYIYRQSLKAEKATSIDKLSPCKKCDLRYICGGGCRIKEFPNLAKMTSFNNIDYNNIPSRICNSTIKERYYDLMIRSNEYLYSAIDAD